MGPKGEMIFRMLSSSGGLRMLELAAGSYLFSSCLYNFLSAPAALPVLFLVE